MSSSNIKIAFIGAGAMSFEHARAFSRLDDVSLCGIYSRTKSKSEELAKNVGIDSVCDSIEALYEECKPDLVVTAVSELSILDVSLDALNYPWAVLLEKPAGLDLQEANRIREKATSLSRSVYVGLNRRFYGGFQYALDLMNSEQGARYATIQDQQSMEEARQYGHPDKVVENWMYANSIHLVDCISFFCRGNLDKVEVLQPWSGDSSCVVLARVSFDSGDVALYEGLWDRPGPWAVSVSTTKIRCTMRPLEAGEFQRYGERSRNPFPTSELDTDYKAGFAVQAEEVVKALKGEESQAATLADSQRSMELVTAIYEKDDS